jgi:hypothetical protein
MKAWYDSLMLEESLIDTVWNEGLRKLDHLMKGGLSKADDFVLGICSACFGFASSAIRGELGSMSQSGSPALSLVKSSDIEEPSMGFSPKLQHALSSVGLDFSAISGFGEVDESTRGCASSMLYVSSVRAPSQGHGMSLMRA